MKDGQRIVLTGFMGVGKSTVAKCLSQFLKIKHIDLDKFIEANANQTIKEMIKEKGEVFFREVETENLRKIIEETDFKIVSLGGGAWVFEQNRKLIKEHGCTTIWLESSFEHCWRNITSSKNVRPLIRDRASTKKLFDERQKYYCLADWHFVVKPELTLFEIAKRIADEVI